MFGTSLSIREAFFFRKARSPIISFSLILVQYIIEGRCMYNPFGSSFVGRLVLFLKCPFIGSCNDITGCKQFIRNLTEFKQLENVNIWQDINLMIKLLNVLTPIAQIFCSRSRRFCGKRELDEVNSNTITRDIDLETSAILVHFHSDDTYTARGFSLDYEILGKVFPPRVIIKL